MDPLPDLSSAEDSGLPNEAAPPDGSILHQLETLRNSYREMECRYRGVEGELKVLKSSNLDLSGALKEAREERDALRVEVIAGEVSADKQEEANMEVRLELESVIEVYKGKLLEIFEEKSRISGVISGIQGSILSAKESFHRIAEMFSNEELGEEACGQEKCEFNDALDGLALESRFIGKLALAVESKVLEHQKTMRKERNEMESSILSLTEENRDISSLLIAAMAEKEAAERNLQKLKDCSEQKRGAIMQMAEKGLQKVGFGFVMGVMGVGTPWEQQESSASSTKSDSSECEEEVTSLASTVDKIMKDLRQEISDLRRDLKEYSSENQHLQSLLDEQAQRMKDDQSYIKDLEERESMLSNSVEELMLEMKEATEEVSRWREACELEVEAGKAAMTERENEVKLLREELERTKTSLNAATSKLSLKEKLASTAMAAQAAAEATLRLADSRSAMFRERMEELAKQLEEEAERRRKETGRGRTRVRRVCWPWQAFIRIPSSSAAASGSSAGRGRMRLGLMPGIEALVQANI